MPRRNSATRNPRRSTRLPAAPPTSTHERPVNAASVATMSAGYRLVAVLCGTPVYAYVDPAADRPADGQ